VLSSRCAARSVRATCCAPRWVVEARGFVEELSIDPWRSALDLMVLGTVATVQAFLSLLREASGLRRIVLTSSIAALSPGRFQGPYRAAKAAVTAIGETLDLELGPEGIGTTIGFPSGMVPAEMLEFARAMTQQDVSADGDDLVLAIAREMAPDPADLAAPEVAAAAMIAAAREGRCYVVTHGVTPVQGARQRLERIDEAITEVFERNG
jgi:NAD(P)-dependent dehydrogenase (short-subunit alcohol dehydrogenase family)